MNRLKNTGLVLCGLVLGLSLSAPAAQAVESLKATLSTNRVLVDGQEVRLTAYNINVSNYVRLRDIGKAVGFEVYWDSENGCVQVESGKPYTGEAPAKAEPDKPLSRPEDTSTTIDVNALKQDIIDRTNALRKENGVAALRINDRLMQAAQVRADEMASSSVYSHTRPDGRRNTSVTDCPYVGENIHRIADCALQGKSVSEAAVWSWNLSGGHRDNLLEKNYAETGVGLSRGVNDSGEACWYCVQLFLWNGYSISWVDTPAAK
ncbi:CAP domain-containing protein [Dysosmobacter sp.]|uniref:CAP domain-containing protein n=1 Tax=Dysosmobacter sp. TaxID=2591382 RepID=UPI003AF0FDC8